MTTQAFSPLFKRLLFSAFCLRISFVVDNVFLFAQSSPVFFCLLFSLRSFIFSFFFGLERFESKPVETEICD